MEITKEEFDLFINGNHKNDKYFLSLIDKRFFEIVKHLTKDKNVKFFDYGNIKEFQSGFFDKNEYQKTTEYKIMLENWQLENGTFPTKWFYEDYKNI